MRTDINNGSLSDLPGTNREKRKLLLIEDDPACIALIKEIFFETGIKVLAAEKGQDGLNLLIQNPDTDVILLDIRLPDIDGFRVFTEIKKIKPLIPVIAITADRLTWSTNDCRSTGLYGFLLKPIEIDVLIKIVNIALDNKINNKNGEP